MCGIIAYIGEREAFPIVLDGLYRLEYRGYDSAGITIAGDQLKTIKKTGKVKKLDSDSSREELKGHVGIGHTRWATHGAPTDANAHPHVSKDGTISVVHNGIIENYQNIKSALIEAGYAFRSETDTEVLAHLIQKMRDSLDLTLEEAVKCALHEIDGAYAIVAVDSTEPDVIVGARKSSPLVLGLGEKEVFLASDATPIARHTNKFIFLEDHQVVKLEQNGCYRISNLDDTEVEPIIERIDFKIEELGKDGFPHFMLKEIFYQPSSIKECMRGRLQDRDKWISIGGLKNEIDRISKANRIILVGCGTSWHTALIAEYLIEEIARIPCEVEYASEFRYRNPIIDEKDVVLVISQSGETADTLAALELAKQKGAFTYGIVNVVGSSIARETHTGSYLHAGPEIGVASTKAFTSQLTLLTMMAVKLGGHRGTINQEHYEALITELAQIPAKIGKILESNDQIKYVASEIKSASNALYLGRGVNFPVALEGALKLKEISYIHAEGYPAAEMKHGPIALIDLYMPVIVVGTNVSAYDKIVSNVEEVKARNAIVISVVNESDERMKELSDYHIAIPETHEILSPILSVIPLQLLAYHIAVMRGCDVDQPRNLAKSVTVE